MKMDLNDFNFDAYLANDRTLFDPEVVAVEKAGRIRLRVINASAATTFWIDTGLPARLVAVDGHAVVPLAGSRFGIAMAQRLDIEIDLPQAGAFPILALREGARERTGLILATTGAAVTKLAGLSDAESPAFDLDLAQEAALQAVTPLAARSVDNAQMIMLAGAMSPYVWTIDGQTWDTHSPITAKSGERVELMFHNMSMMAHPMHLHGHVFQVVNINGREINGALRDTVYVPPMAQDHRGLGCRRGRALDAALPPHAASFDGHDDRVRGFGVIFGNGGGGAHRCSSLSANRTNRGAMKRRVFMQSGLATAAMASPAAARPPFRLGQAPVPLLSPPFQDVDGSKLTLADFAGKVVLLNIWATWCPPCRTEMPALDRVQGQLGSAEFSVLALSIDDAGIGAANAFYRDIEVRNLGLYWAEDVRVQLALGFRGLPTSLLIDRAGAEIARLSGPAEWDSKSAIRQLSRVIEGG